MEELKKAEKAEGKNDRTVSFLRKTLPFWEALRSSEREMLQDSVSWKQVTAGQVVYSAGQSCLGVLLIASGRLKASMFSMDGKEILLYYIGSGDASMLTASCILNNAALPILLTAEEDSLLCIIPPELYTALRKTSPQAEKYISEVLMSSFSRSMEAVQQAMFLTVDQRIAMFLLQRRSYEQSLTLHLTQEKIAQELGTAREVVSRTLKRFSEEGLIRTGRGVITILDEKGLSRQAPE